ncbi:MAG TPA: barstar family protein [Acidobacteriaceae bacterium]
MDDIRLDGRSWQSADDFYAAYFACVGAPEWHGRNLDAVWDSLTGGDINQRNPPFRICIVGLEQMGPEAKQMTERFAALVKQAKSEGHVIELELSAI